MIAFQRLSASVRGLLWLVRGGGLRASVRNLDGRLRQVDEALHRPTAAPPDLAAVRAAVEALAREVGALRHEAAGGRAVCDHLVAGLDALRAELGTDRLHVQALGGRIAALGDGLAQVRQELRTGAGEERRAAWQRVGDLRGFEFTVCSQNGEDGILQEIFRRIGTANRFFVEFGVETGLQCNSAYLARDKGWSGLFMEADATDFAKLEENYRASPGVRCLETVVTPGNIEELLARYEVPVELDLLSIDIDGNDYWVWKAVTNWHPRAVVIEYNPFYPPPRKWVMKEDPNYVWKRTTYFGASLTSLTLLGRQKGYTLVGTDSMGVNAFFVRDDLFAGKFLDPVLMYHFTEFGYNAPAPFDGPYEEI